MAVEHDYYSVKAVSASLLKKFRTKGPMAFQLEWLGKSEPLKPSKQMLLGTAIHCIILEPDVFKEKYALEGSDYHKSRDAEGLPVTPLPAQDWDACHYLRDNFFNLAMIRELWLDPFIETETPKYWDSPLGFKMKALADAYSPSNKTLIDLKTTSSPLVSLTAKDFSADIFNFNYDIQQVHYCSGFNTPFFYFVALETSAPFQVRIFRLDEEAIAYAEEEYRKTLIAIRPLLDSANALQICEPWDNRIIDVSLPSYLKYAKKQKAY